ncbi:hypothetical protein SRHO_G00080240 [Serrasalmus rhombeus]
MHISTVNTVTEEASDETQMLVGCPVQHYTRVRPLYFRRVSMYACGKLREDERRRERLSCRTIILGSNICLQSHMPREQMLLLPELFVIVLRVALGLGKGKVGLFWLHVAWPVGFGL